MGKIIKWDTDGRPIVPDNPIIPFIKGDGIGPDIWAAAKPVFDKAVAHAYQGRRLIVWHELAAGEAAQEIYGPKTLLPSETLEDLARYGVAIKGPLTTPVGGSFRSLNVSLRQDLDLYACVRPVSHITGVPAPVVHPERLNVVIFRENTEDVYSGVEWKAESEDARDVLEFINKKLKASDNKPIPFESAIGIKPMSRANSG